jgi:Phage tail protein
MLTKVDIDDLQGHTLSLPMQPTTPGYIVREIEGLDPVKATITATEFGQLDGSQFQSARREPRDLKLRIGLEPYFAGGSSVSALRTALYRCAMPKGTVKLTFYIDDVASYTISGVVETFETPLFAKDPEVSIGVRCMDPDFLAISETTVNGNSVSTTTEQTVTVDGTVEAGYIFTLSVNRTGVAGFTLYNRRPDGSMAQLDVTLALTTGDVVKISTQPKNKYATLTRGGSTTSILYAVSNSSKWGPLYPDLNYIRVLISGAAIPYTIVYTNRYGGL